MHRCIFLADRAGHYLVFLWFFVLGLVFLSSEEYVYVRNNDLLLHFKHQSQVGLNGSVLKLSVLLSTEALKKPALTPEEYLICMGVAVSEAHN